MTTVIIRPACPDDLQALPLIERAAAAIFRTTPYAYLADDDPVSSEVDLAHEHVWVAVDQDDKPIAFALVHVLDTSVHLPELDVHPDYARQGLGRRLIATVADWVRARGATALTLTTFDDVPWNGPYYTRLGFRTLELAKLSPGLQAIRQGEAEAGLPMEHRVVLALLGTHAARQLRQAHAVIAQLAHLHVETLPARADARLHLHVQPLA